MNKDLIDDHDSITKVLELYMAGSADGDAASLREAFHPEARMFGRAGEDRLDMPITEFFKLAAEGRANTAGNYRGRVVSVTQVGDAAVAVVAEDGFWGTVSFVDFFSLARIDGRWWIVNKTFAHTGGEMPAH